LKNKKKLLISTTTILFLLFIWVIYQVSKDETSKSYQQQSNIEEKTNNLDEQLNNDSNDINVFISKNGVEIHLSKFESGDSIASPLTLTGEVPGTWSFEASFPVVLKDADGLVIAQEPAKLQGDWMTNDFVSFQVKLTFNKPAAKTGFLILQKDNPSGLVENDDSLEIPVRFN
jgi:hypothetical protein